MDVKLRRLKRLAESDPSFWPVYIRALEQALGGIVDFEPIHHVGIFTESYVADARLSNHKNDIIRIGGFHLVNINDEHIAWMVDIDWEDSWDNPEAIKLMLSDKFLALMQTAKNHGYQYILLWRD